MGLYTARHLYYTVKRQYSNDFVDRLNHVATPIFLLTLSFIQGFSLIVSFPIACMSLASDDSKWYGYINYHCKYFNKFVGSNLFWGKSRPLQRKIFRQSQCCKFSHRKCNSLCATRQLLSMGNFNTSGSSNLCCRPSLALAKFLLEKWNGPSSNFGCIS